MKNILLGLGFISSTIIPVIAVVSCSGEEDTHKMRHNKKVKPIIESTKPVTHIKDSTAVVTPPHIHVTPVIAAISTWSTSDPLMGVIPSELSTFITSGNKDVIIHLSETQTTYDASSILAQIKSNTKLKNANGDSVVYLSSFANGIDKTSLSVEEHVYTLSDPNGISGHAIAITYTFKIMSPPHAGVMVQPTIAVIKDDHHDPIRTESEWITYLEDSSNGFEQSFVNKAKYAITWTLGQAGKIALNGFKDVHFPAKFILPEVVEIDDHAFDGATLPFKFAIPSSAVKIGTNIFNHSTFSVNGTLTLPSTMTRFPDNIFQGAKLPSNFVIPSSITTIGVASFAQVHFARNSIFTIPLGVTKIELNAFAFAVVPDGFTIPSSVKTIEKWAFSNTNLPHSFIVPMTVTSLHAIAFTDSKNRNGGLYTLVRT